MVTPGTSRAGLLESAAVIVRDEFPMANTAVIEAVHNVHNVCCIIKGSERPFGGIPFTGIGDFRQVGPVVKRLPLRQLLTHASRPLFLWPSFRAFSLHYPIRSAADPEYTAFVDAIGENIRDNYVSFHHFYRP